MKIIVAMTGSSGTGYGVRLLEALKEAKVETFLVMSEWAEKVIEQELSIKPEEVRKLATHVLSNKDMAASISSSSFLVDGMIVIPATVKTISEIATAHTGTLIARAADNMLRTRKRLVVAFRETPISIPTIENLGKISQAGGIVMPLTAGFYHRPEKMEEVYDFSVGKALDLLGVENKKFRRWA
jgi:4-hydroxy-3-polyprenylbenzoate decarboxylase